MMSILPCKSLACFFENGEWRRLAPAERKAIMRAGVPDG
jgi:hypothetical protein